MRTTGNYKHGGKGTRLYHIWKSMRERCTCPHSNRFQHYGGKGIKVCSEWDDFAKFREWAYQNGYNDTLTIDRIELDKGYCPENCRWATYTEQANNKSNSVRVTFNGETHTYAEWGRILKIKASTIQARIKHYGWSPEKALTTPLRKKAIV